MSKKLRLSRLGIATVAAGAPIAGLMVFAQPASASFISSPGINGPVNDHVQVENMFNNSSFQLCASAKNDNSGSFDGHFEYFDEVGSTWVEYAATGPIDFVGGGAISDSFCASGGNVNDNQKVALIKGTSDIAYAAQ